MNQIIQTKQIKKQFTKYVIPSVVGMLVQSLYVILDGVVVGQGIGEIALGAINIVFPFSMLVVALSMLIAVGGANVYSFHKGQGETEKANNIFCQCVALAAIVGAVLALFGFFCSEGLSIFLGANEELLPSAVIYLKWSAPFAFIQMIAFGLSVFVRNDENPRIAMVGAVCGAVINAILDIVFILILHYGVEVAALTNGIGVSIELVFYLSHFARKKGMLRIRKPNFNWDEIKRVLSNGLASSLMEFSVPAFTFSYNLAVVHVAGTLGVSAYSIVSYVCSIINMVVIGIAQGVQPLMSFYHGKKDRKKFNIVYHLGLKANITVSVFLVAVCVLFGKWISPLFLSGNPELTELAAYMLRQYPLAYLFIGITMMNILFFQTAERNAYATFISFLRCLGFVQVFILLSMFGFGGKGLYLTFLAGEVCHFIISQVLVRNTTKKINAQTAEAISDAVANGNARVITISREFGSGGRIIARRVAEALDFPFHDKEIIGLAAGEGQLAAGIVEQTEEKMEKGFKYGLFMGRRYCKVRQ